MIINVVVFLQVLPKIDQLQLIKKYYTKELSISHQYSNHCTHFLDVTGWSLKSYSWSMKP